MLRIKELNNLSKSGKLIYLSYQKSTQMKPSSLSFLVAQLINELLPKVELYVDAFKSKHPDCEDLVLADRLISKEALKGGLSGAVCGAIGVAGMPAATIIAIRIQVFLVLSVALLSGRTKNSTDFESDVMLLIIGNSAKEGLKVGLTKVAAAATKNAAKGFSRITPFIGVPIGFGTDYWTTRSVGYLAIKYYNS